MRRSPVTPGELNTAQALRREGKSIREVAEAMGVSRSTVGGWLHGVGERASVETCWCGQRFIAYSAKARSCSPAHAEKRRKTFGPLRDGQ